MRQIRHGPRRNLLRNNRITGNGSVARLRQVAQPPLRRIRPVFLDFDSPLGARASPSLVRSDRPEVFSICSSKAGGDPKVRDWREYPNGLECCGITEGRKARFRRRGPRAKRQVAGRRCPLKNDVDRDSADRRPHDVQLTGPSARRQRPLRLRPQPRWPSAPVIAQERSFPTVSPFEGRSAGFISKLSIIKGRKIRFVNIVASPILGAH